MGLGIPPLEFKILLESNPANPSEIQNLSTEIGRKSYCLIPLIIITGIIIMFIIIIIIIRISITV